MFQCSGDAVSEYWAVRHYQVLVTMATVVLLSHLSGFRQSAVAQHFTSSMRDWCTVYCPTSGLWSKTTAAGITHTHTHTHQMSCFIDLSLSLHAAQTVIQHGCNFSAFSVSPGADSKHEGTRECRRKREKKDRLILLLSVTPAVARCVMSCAGCCGTLTGRNIAPGGLISVSFQPVLFSFSLSYTLQWCSPILTQHSISLYFHFLYLWYIETVRSLAAWTSVVLFMSPLPFPFLELVLA